MWASGWSPIHDALETPNGKYKGFLVDLVEAMATEMGAGIEFVTKTSYSYMVPLKTGETNAIVGTGSTYKLELRKRLWAETVATEMAESGSGEDAAIDAIVDAIAAGTHPNPSGYIPGKSDTYSYSYYSYDGVKLDFANDFLFPTTSILEVRASGLVHLTARPTSLFQFGEPFTGTLWLAIGGFVCFLAVCLVAIEWLWPRERSVRSWALSPHRLCSGKDAAYSFYHVLAAVLGGEDYEWMTFPSRVLRIGMLFGILVLQASYTANLAAFFTKPNVIIHGPNNMEELTSSTACVTHKIEGYWESVQQMHQKLEPFTLRTVSPDLYDDSSIHPWTGVNMSTMFQGLDDADWEFTKRRHWCAEALRKGICDIFIDDAVALQKYLFESNNCVDLRRADWLDFLPRRFHLFAPNAVFAKRLSLAYLHVAMSPLLMRLEQDHYHAGKSCPAPSADSDKIDVEGLSGLFLAWAVTSVFAVGIAACLRGTATHARVNVKDPKGGTDEDPDAAPSHLATEGEMLRYLIKRVDQMSSDTPKAVTTKAHEASDA